MNKTILAFLLVFVFCFSTVSYAYAENNYIIVDNSVQNRDQSKYVVSVEPYKISDGFIIISAESKTFSGEIDFCLGLDSDVLKPTRAYIERYITVQKSYQVPEDCFFNYTTNPKHLYVYKDVAGRIFEIFDHEFSSYDFENRMIYWLEDVPTWVDVSHKFDSRNYDFKGCDRWYFYKNFNIESGETYRLKVFLNLEQISLGLGDYNKYIVAFKKSSDTLQEAITNNRFYLLDPWYNAGWGYRKSHDLNNATDAGTLYQVLIVVNYGAGADSGNNVYLDSNSQTDFDDVRFTDDDGETLLDYWLENKTDSDLAYFWVEVADSLSSDQTIYIYYGNADAASLSDGDDTFLLYDHFEGVSVNATKWTQQNAGDISVGSSEIVLDTDNTQQTTGIKSVSTFTPGFAIETRAKYTGTGNGVDWGMVAAFGTTTTDFAGFDLDVGATGYWNSHNHAANGWYLRKDGLGGSTFDSESETLIYNTYYRNAFAVCDTTSDIEKGWRDNILKISFNDGNYTSSTKNIILLVRQGAANYDTTGTLDFMFLRKYVDPEPTHGAWGAEEEYTAPAAEAEPAPIQANIVQPTLSPWVILGLSIFISLMLFSIVIIRRRD